MMKKLVPMMLLILFTKVALGQASIERSGDEYPNKPVTLVVGYPPGPGGNDLFARLIGEKLQSKWQHSFIVANKPGADTAIAASQVARATPDGYTLFVNGSGGMSVNPALKTDLPYDSVSDFEPICLLGRSDMMLVVNPSVPATTGSEFLAYAKKHPGVLNYSAGTSFYQLVTEVFKDLSGTDIVHIPYQGGAPSVNAVVSGEVQMTIVNIGSVKQLVESGRLKALAVTSPKRLDSFPNVPTFGEIGIPSFDLFVWIGLFAPSNTPAKTISKLSSEVSNILNLPEVHGKLVSIDFEPPSECSPKSLAGLMADEIQRYKAVARSSGMVSR